MELAIRNHPYSGTVKFEKIFSAKYQELASVARFVENNNSIKYLYESVLVYLYAFLSVYISAYYFTVSPFRFFLFSYVYEYVPLPSQRRCHCGVK